MDSNKIQQTQVVKCLNRTHAKIAVLRDFPGTSDFVIENVFLN